MRVFKAVTETVQNNWNRYWWSSLVTFLSACLAVFAFDLQVLEFSVLETAGLSGSISIISRLIVKAAFEGFKALVVWWVDNRPPAQ